MTHPVICRLCGGRCGLLAEVADGRITALTGDPSDPISGGFICETARSSPAALQAEGRITRPLQRVDGRLEPATWADAVADIGGRLKALRRRSGARSIGLHLDAAASRSSADLLRALAFAMATGTPSVFSAAASLSSPRLRMTELMLGHPIPLMSDLGRAHHVVLLGGDQRSLDWGPDNAGMLHESLLMHSRRTKGTRVVVVDPRRTPLADALDQHLPILPGTEVFLLLGMLSAAVSGGWIDRQYTDKYTRNHARLPELLAPWSVARCAEICGLETAQLSGMALKFCRAAMAVVHPGRATFAGPHSSVAAWAWLTLHAVTANLLRPGGLYENQPVIDLHPLFAAIPAAGAPRTRVSGVPLTHLQAPDHLLADEILVPGEGQVRALIAVGSGPGPLLTERDVEALSRLELLVCLAGHPSAVTERAHWVLPICHPWERAELQLLELPVLPRRSMGWSPALVAPVGEARTAESVLRELLGVVSPGLSGSAWGRHFTLLGRWLAGADLDALHDRALSWLLEEGEDPRKPPFRVDRGETDRAGWQIGHEDGRIDLLPEPVAPLLAALTQPAAPPGQPLRLRCSTGWRRAARWSTPEAPVLRVHPEQGFADGVAARLSTPCGAVDVQIRVDATLRPDAVDLEAAGLPTLTRPPEQRDPLTGVAAMDGIPASLGPRTGATRS